MACPECNFLNTIFDTFYTLNLNIPLSNKKNENITEFSIFYVQKYCLRTPVKIIFEKISKNANFLDCFNCLKNKTNFKFHNLINNFIINRISNKKSIDIFNLESSSEIEEYEIEDNFFSVMIR